MEGSQGYRILSFSFLFLFIPACGGGSDSGSDVDNGIDTSGDSAQGRIAFVMTDTASSVISGGLSNIGTINADGTEFSQITNDASHQLNPAWSPDGSKIVYSASNIYTAYIQEIYIMNADGSVQTRVTMHSKDDLRPAWSPVENIVAFDSFPSFGAIPCIYAMDIDTRTTYLLTDNWDSAPDWSPDGKHIVFQSMRNGQFDIYVMDSDGANQNRLTTYQATAPSWSPDGSKIAFSSIRNGTNEIFIVNADGSDPSKLVEGTSPDWSPDGNWIVFVYNYNIHIINIDGSDKTNLTAGYETHTLNKFHSPSWAPKERDARLEEMGHP